MCPFLATLCNKIQMLALLLWFFCGVGNCQLASAQSVNALAQKANQLFDEGNTYYAQHSREGELKAMQLYLGGLRLAKQSGDLRAIGRGEFLMGAAFDAGGRMPEALAQYKKALAVFTQLEDNCWQVNCLQGVAGSFAKQQQRDSCRVYHTMARARVRQCADLELKVRVLCYALFEASFQGFMPESRKDTLMAELRQIVDAAWADTLVPHETKVLAKTIFLGAEATVWEGRYNVPRVIEIRQQLAALLTEPTDINRVGNYQILIGYLRKARRFEEALSYQDSIMKIFHNSNAEDVAAATNLGTEFQAQLAAERAQRAEEDLEQSEYLFGGAMGVALMVSSLALGLWNSNRRRRRTNRQLAESKAEKDVLLHELHHRVKNNLQMLSTMLTMQANRLEDGHAREVVLQSRRRIDAIASVHRNLHSGDISATVNLADFLSELMTNLSSDTSQMVQVEMNLARIEAKQEVAVPIGILVNELITNSIKHAMDTKGRLMLNLALVALPENEVELVYSDSGKGLPFPLETDKPGHFGLRLIQLMVSQLEAELDIEGSTWRIRFPLD